MGLNTIWGLIIIFVFYLLVSQYIVKRLKIKRPRKRMFTEGRKNSFIVAEIIIMILFIISVFSLINYFPDSRIIPVLPFFLYFSLIYLIRGIEEWVVNKNDKGYYHEWLASSQFLMMLLFIIFAEMIRL